ncbi:Rab9 effector protein [Crotalus adamanteus]|uniref:Rab9 effector protein n=1 Tax=Crotalus adamanteus TaxID=8729 RepID=A0AAW1CAM9_CROAD
MFEFLCSLPLSQSHSATLLKNKLVIFGGQRTSTYLNDTHILDLGKKGTMLAFLNITRIWTVLWSINQFHLSLDSLPLAGLLMVLYVLSCINCAVLANKFETVTF